MKARNVLLIAGLLTFVGCTNNAQRNKNVEEVVVEERNANGDFVVDSDEGDLILELDENKAETVDTSSTETGIETGSVATPEVTNEFDDLLIDEQKGNEVAVSAPIDSTGTGKYGEYVVQKGDTLMLIAFKLFGDYSKWREISKHNNISQSLRAGAKIKYEMTGELFQWNPQGDPHLIKRGETLGTISNEKYGTPKKWKGIWENNKPLIKNPNLIFAGFTIYYIPDREVASQQ